jgi:hypothetical protein
MTDVFIPRAAYPRDMSLPVRVPDTVTAYCATCGHSGNGHSESGNQRCLVSACGCNAFIVGVVPEVSA